MSADGGVTEKARRPGQGSMDKEIIRRIIRRHLEAVRTCYERVLTSDSHPSGRVLARFVIARTGKVTTSCVVSTTLQQIEAERCIVDDILTWSFPKPLGGGWIVVDYPFVFVPAEAKVDTSSGAPRPAN